MQPHELNALSDQFVVALRAKLPPHLANCCDDDPACLRDAARPHVERLAGEGKALEDAASLVADVVAALVPDAEGADEAEDEGPPKKARAKGHK